MTINGDDGNDTVNLNADITFASDHNLNVDLQNDATAGDVDQINVGTNANLVMSGIGAITARASRNVAMASGSSFVSVNGAVTVEANQQGTPTTGTFIGVDVNSAVIQATGTGVVTVNGKGGTGAGGQHGVRITGAGALVKGGTGAGTATSVLGVGGAGSGGNSVGVLVTVGGATITSFGGNVSVTGTGGSGGASDHQGVRLFNGVVITAGGSGTVLVTGTGGSASSGGSNIGVDIRSNDNSTSALITSSGGGVTVNGFGGTGSGGSNIGVNLVANNTPTATITSGGGGSVTVNGTGGTGAAGNNDGIEFFRSARITSGGAGNVIVDGTGGNGTDSEGVQLVTDGTLASISSGGGTITVTGASSTSTAILLGGPSNNCGGSGCHISSGSNAAVTLIGDSMALATGLTTSVSAGSGPVTLRQKTIAVAIELGSATDPFAGSLSLTDAELDRVTAGTLNIGNANTGNVQVTGVISQTKTTNISTPVATLVFASGDLGIFGTVNNPLSVNPGGTLRPGASPGVINSGNLALGAGSNFAVEIGGATAGNGAGFHDQVNVTGIVDVTGANLSLAAFGGFTPTAGQQYVIINNDLADPVGGTFAGLSQGATIAPFLIPGMQATISYVGGDGNDIVLTAMLPPAIITLSDPNPIGFGNVTVGNYSPAQTYNVSGVNLTANIVVTAPTHFEVSLSQFNGFGPSVNIPFGSGTVTNVPVYVRFVPTAPGSFSNPITHTSGAAPQQNKTALGTGVAAVCVAPPPNMVTWYSGEGNANDRFGVINGNFINGAIYNPGKVGQAFDFDAVDSMVTIPGTGAMNFVGNQMSMDGWIYPRTNVSGTFYFAKSANSDHPYVLYFAGTAVRVIVSTTSLDNQEFDTGYAPPTNAWTHLAMTYDGSLASNQLKVFANGVQVFQTTTVGANLRMGAKLLTVDDIAGGSQVTMEFTFEVEGVAKPSCVAECVFRYYV